MKETAARITHAFEGATATAHDTHAVVSLPDDAVAELVDWLARELPDIEMVGRGRRMEVYKEVGRPETVTERFDLAAMKGTHAIGHTRMATESAVTTDGAHPYSTGKDQCLVHNGSLSNHNNLRRVLAREGFTFETENDTEVAAGYLSWKMREGLSLDDALKVSLDDLDGFYTFVVGTENGFGVLARRHRLQAGDHGRDRALCRLRLRISRAGRPARHRELRASGSPSPPRSISGSANRAGCRPRLRRRSES